MALVKLNKTILSLDVSTKTGFAVLKYDGSIKLEKSSTIYYDIDKINLDKFDHEELNKFIERVVYFTNKVQELIKEHNPDIIVIEQTVLGRQRYVQRLLEWIHYGILEGAILKANLPFIYLDPSEWRSILELKMSKDDKTHNKNIKKLGKRGKLTKKHLSVRMANDMFPHLNLKIKDNDQSDAILLGVAYLKREYNVS